MLDCFGHGLFAVVFWLHSFGSDSDVSHVRLLGSAENGVGVLRVVYWAFSVLAGWFFGRARRQFFDGVQWRLRKGITIK